MSTETYLEALQILELYNKNRHFSMHVRKKTAKIGLSGLEMLFAEG